MQENKPRHHVTVCIQFPLLVNYLFNSHKFNRKTNTNFILYLTFIELLFQNVLKQI